MASWQRIVIALVLLFVLARCASVEKAKVKKKRDRGKGKNPPKNRETLESLQQLCQRNGSGSSRKNILELQAFFDLTKSFACLKVETCSRVPVCFVEDTPDLEHSSLNNCALWNLLFNGLQANRKIEPVFEHPMNSAHGGKSRSEYSWDDAVSSLCRGANVYRFLTEDPLHEENTSTNGTSKNSTNITTVAPPTQATNASSPRPQHALPRRNRQRRGGPFNKFLRQMKRRQNANNNSSCSGLEACTRICVGQNERPTHVSDCSTFKIHCTLYNRAKKGRKHKGKNKRRNGKSGK